MCLTPPFVIEPGKTLKVTCAPQVYDPDPVVDPNAEFTITVVVQYDCGCSAQTVALPVINKVENIAKSSSQNKVVLLGCMHLRHLRRLKEAKFQVSRKVCCRAAP